MTARIRWTLAMWLCIGAAVAGRLVTGSERWGVVTLVGSAGTVAAMGVLARQCCSPQPRRRRLDDEHNAGKGALGLFQAGDAGH